MGLQDFSMEHFRKLGYWDIGIMKLCLLSIGMIFGAYLADFVIKNVYIFGAVFVVTLVYLFWKMFR